ncbi:MAG: DsbA family protein [Candidatus Altiarchaeota archaeon]|nr:DsbA family protein [Candidatus Altiarchaeota archaeon]
MVSKKKSFSASVLGLLKRNEVLTALLILNVVLVASNLYMTRALPVADIVAAPEMQPQVQSKTQPKAQPAPAPTIAVSSDDDPSKGSPDAPLTLIEFGDYGCGYCGRFYTETLPLIVENYVNTGKVRYVYRDFLRGNSKAAEASECADDQGKFWEYHEILFKRSSDWRSKGIDAFKDYASELELNTETFNSCLDSGEKLAEAQKDTNDGSSYGVSGTPTFFINGFKFVGAQPYENFQAAIEQVLAQ